MAKAPKYCAIPNSHLEKKDKLTAEPDAAAVLQQADDLHAVLTVAGYKNITDVIPVSRKEEIIPDDIISVLTNGLMRRDQFAATKDRNFIRNVHLGIQDLATALTTAKRNITEFTTVIEEQTNALNLIRHTKQRGNIVTRIYEYFNPHKLVLGAREGLFDIFGAYIQIINKVPLVRDWNERLKKIKDVNRTMGAQILNNFGMILSDASNQLHQLTDGQMNAIHIREHLKFFDPSYGLYNREDINNYSKMSKTFEGYLTRHDIHIETPEHIEDGARLYDNIYAVFFNTAREVWNLNYGKDLTTRMIQGEFADDLKITWDDITEGEGTILGLEKSLMNQLQGMYETAERFVDPLDKKEFQKLLDVFNTGVNEAGDLNAPIRQFYLPFLMKENARLDAEANIQNFRGTKEDPVSRYSATIFSFLHERETSFDIDDDSADMEVALFQRMEQMMFGANNFASMLFGAAADGFTKDTMYDLDPAVKDAIKKYARNVTITGSPSKKLSYGKERYKQLLRLSSIFPAMMIARMGAGIRNLVGAGMGLYNADWAGFAMNSDFKKAMKDTGEYGDLARTIDRMVETGRISPGLAKSFIDSSRFIEIQSKKYGTDPKGFAEKFLTRIESSLMKFADWSVNGYFMKNIDWYRNTFTVPGSEHVHLRAHLKTILYQAVAADVNMLKNLRHHDTTDIQDNLTKILAETDVDSRNTATSLLLEKVSHQLMLANKHKNKPMQEKFSRLVNILEQGGEKIISTSNQEFIEGFVKNFQAELSQSEIEEIVDARANFFKARIDEQLGDFSPEGKPYIENIYLDDAETYFQITLGGILKAASYFNVVGRTTSVAYMQGLHHVAGTLMGRTGKEVAGWEKGLKGMTDMQYGGAATASVGLGTILALYGLMAGLFKRNLMIGTALSMNPFSNYVPPARLASMELITGFGILSGMGVSVPEEIREMVYKDNIRWASGAIAGKTAAQLYEETMMGDRPMNPYKYVVGFAEDLIDLPDLISFGLKDLRMDDDMQQYYDWRKQIQNVLTPINHLAPVYVGQQALQTLVDVMAPKDERGFRVMSNNIRNSLANWVGVAVWSHVNEPEIFRPTFDKQRMDAKIRVVEDVGRSIRWQRPSMNIPRERLARLHKRLKRYNTMI